MLFVRVVVGFCLRFLGFLGLQLPTLCDVVPRLLAVVTSTFLAVGAVARAVAILLLLTLTGVSESTIPSRALAP